MRIRMLLLAAVAAFSVSSAAQAALVTFNYTGTIGDVQGPGSLYAHGDVLNFSVTFEPSTAPFSSTGTTAIYFSGLQSISFGSVVYTVDGSSILGVSTISNNTTVLSPGPLTDQASFGAMNFDTGNGAVGFVFTQSGANPTALTSLNLPGSFLNPTLFDSAIASYTVDGSMYSAELQAISAVPEPSTWAMMILGFAAVGFVAYRRSKKLVAVAA